MNFGGITAPKLSPVDMARIPPERLTEIEKEYAASVFQLLSGKLEKPLEDPRFQSKVWHEGWSSFIYQMYLINAQHLTTLAQAVEAEPKVKQKIVFATEQLVSTMAPTNFLATNPEAIQELIQTNGQSFTNGLKNLLSDLQVGKISQSDANAFEIGKNIATSEGAVIYQNTLFQLIQYKPQTATVHEKPFLMVPPCINKFYILDLQPQTSFVQYLLAEGFTVYMVSWKNPDLEMTKVTWDDYVGVGVIEAIRVCMENSGQPKINVLGFCVGGTLVSCALAVLAARKVDVIQSVTLLTSFIDFSDTGVLDVFIDEAMVELRENTIGGKNNNFGLLSGVELANTFSFLRPNDLVWNYVVSNYLLGKSPPSFDLLYWNGDSTNLPGPMYAYYLRHMYLNNELKEPNRLTVCETAIDVSKIQCPAYIYASREDHIVPWKSAYNSTQILKGQKRFVLGASGHIAGVINPPQKKKRNYWISDQLPKNAQDWYANAKSIEGSWWPDFSQWLAAQSGKKIKAKSTLGGTKYKVIESAPGSYVKEKAVKV
jgi:polyhydroxyalkanoate synthase subunit PhaC